MPLYASNFNQRILYDSIQYDAPVVGIMHVHISFEPEYAVGNLQSLQGIDLEIRSSVSCWSFHKIHIVHNQIVYALMVVTEKHVLDPEHLSLCVWSNNHVIEIGVPSSEIDGNRTVIGTIEHAAFLYFDYETHTGDVDRAVRDVPGRLDVGNAIGNSKERIVRLLMVERLSRRVVSIVAIDIGIVEHAGLSRRMINASENAHDPKQGKEKFFHKKEK